METAKTERRSTISKLLRKPGGNIGFLGTTCVLGLSDAGTGSIIRPIWYSNCVGAWR